MACPKRRVPRLRTGRSLIACATYGSALRVVSTTICAAICARQWGMSTRSMRFRAGRRAAALEGALGLTSDALERCSDLTRTTGTAAAAGAITRNGFGGASGAATDVRAGEEDRRVLLAARWMVV